MLCNGAASYAVLQTIVSCGLASGCSFKTLDCYFDILCSKAIATHFHTILHPVTLQPKSGYINSLHSCGGGGGLADDNNY